jgi:hypothetical protein
VAEEFLDVADVGAAFEEVGSEAVAEGMGAGASRDAGTGTSEFDDFLGGPDGERAVGAGAREEPGGGAILAYVVAESGECAFGEESVAVLSTFARADMDELAVGIDVVDAQADDFSDAEAGGIEEHEESAVLEVVGCVDDATGILATEDGGETTVALGSGDGGERVGDAKDVLKEEAECAERLSVIGDGDIVALNASKEVIAGLLFCDRNRWSLCATQECADVVVIGTSGTLTVAAQRHFLEQLLEQDWGTRVIDQLAFLRVDVVCVVGGRPVLDGGVSRTCPSCSVGGRSRAWRKVFAGQRWLRVRERMARRFLLLLCARQRRFWRLRRVGPPTCVCGHRIVSVFATIGDRPAGSGSVGPGRGKRRRRRH